MADAAGNIGSVETRVDATLKKLGRFAVSELFLTWSGADPTPRFLALETIPADATTLRVALELYPDAAAAEAEVSVRFELVPVGGSTSALSEEARAVRDGTLLAVGVDVPVTDLAAGVYTVKAAVLESGREIGLATTVIEKPGEQDADRDRRRRSAPRVRAGRVLVVDDLKTNVRMLEQALAPGTVTRSSRRSAAPTRCWSCNASVPIWC